MAHPTSHSLLLSSLLCGGCLLATGSAFGASGDTQATATCIGSLPYNDTGTTVGATDDYNLPADVSTPTLTATCAAIANGAGPAGSLPRGAVYAGTGTGPDVVYQLSFPSGNPDTLTITMDPTGAQDLAIITYCNTVSSSLADGLAIDDTGTGGVAESVTVGNIAAGTTLYIVVDGYSTGGTPPGPSGPYTLSVTSNGTTQPAPCNGASSADLSITKSDGATTATPGGTTIYTIVAANAGPSAATGASVTDAFPAACTSATYTSVAAGGATGNTAAGNGNINDAALNLPVGASVTYTATCTINPTAPGTLTNTATIASATTDPTPGNNSATDTDTLAALADLSISKTDTPDPVTAGNDLTYTITVNNAGPSNAGSVSLSDPLPAGTTFVSLSSPGGWSCTTPAVGAGGTVSCSIPSLGVGSSAVFTLTVQVGASAIAGLSNTATITSATLDGNAGNNTATATTAVVSLPTTAQGNAGGGLVTAAITGGTCAGFALGSTSFTTAPTPLPPGITFPYGMFGFTAVCPSGGTVTLTLTYPNLLPAGTQYWKYGPTSGNPAAHWYVLPATITGNTAVFTITDGGLGDDDLDPNNGVIVDQGGPGVPGAGNGTAAIPTLGEWALLILSTLLGGLIWRARRRTGYGSP